MGVGKKYVDDTCSKLNAEQMLSGQSWFRVDVPRSGDGKHSDPYWFHPDGFRFRSIREIDRWRDSGWDLNALPKTAFQEKKTDGLGISREGAIANNVLTRENLEAIKQGYAVASSGDLTSPGVALRKRSAAGGDEGSSSMKRMRLPYAPTTAEGLSLFTQCKDKSRFRTISSVTPHTVCSIYQKLTWIGDLAVTHFIGADMRCVLPKDIFVFQRTVYDAIKTFCVPPFEQLANQSDGTGLEAPFDSGCVMIARCEVRATTKRIFPLNKNDHIESSNEGALTSGKTSSSVDAQDPLDLFFNVLNARFRVGFCQTLDNNNQIYVVPKYTPTRSGATSVVSPSKQEESTPASTSAALTLDPSSTSSEQLTSSAEETIWKIINECENASSFPERGTEDAFIVMLLRNLDGPTLCTSPSVGELEAQSSVFSSPPSREARIPAATSLDEWAKEHPGRVAHAT